MPECTTIVRYISVSQSFAQSKSFRNSYTDDALRSNELDELVLNGSYSVSLAIGLEVAQVTNVAFLVLRSAVGLGEGVD